MAHYLYSEIASTSATLARLRDTANCGKHDYRTGDETRHSYHPYNFTDEQLAEIVKRVKA